MSNYLQVKKFSDINLDDPFFNSLKSDYNGFKNWFERKKEKKAYVLEDNGVQGFLYLKEERDIVEDVDPIIEANSILKVGTMKVNPHGTRLGERFIKKAFDHAIKEDVDIIYVTVFRKHQALVELFKKYGFKEHGTKTTENGTELVLTKDLKVENDLLLDYPFINTDGVNKYILSIHPKFHSRMFPDSLLNNETFDLLQDKSHTNSIHKIYICKMEDVVNFNSGDLIVIYRTTDIKGRAEYRSVVTSICVVEEVKTKHNFNNVHEYLAYTENYSIFNERELRYYYNQFNPLYIIKMTYNAALEKRLIRKKLIEDIGIKRDQYWGIVNITDQQFNDIVRKGDINESLIID